MKKQTDKLSTATGKPEETTLQRNTRIVAQAMARKQRLSLEDAVHLASGFMVKNALSTMHNGECQALRRDLERLERELSNHSALAKNLEDVARDPKDRVACGVSAVIWLRASNLVNGILRKRFSTDTVAPEAMEGKPV